MADKKISALTAASTPLAGTEVLPIVQSGATVKVAVSDLTAARAVSALSLTTATVQATNSSGLAIKNSGAATQLSLGAGGGNNITLSVATSFSDNIIQGTAGKGINFTANTPQSGMTSELLNWYEEGTFDPRLSFATGGDTFTYDARAGAYTRVGRLVTLNILISTTAKGAGTGNLSLINLPFTAAGYASVVPRTSGITNTGPISAYTFSGQSSLSFFTVSSVGTETQITNTSVGAAVVIAASLTYITS